MTTWKQVAVRRVKTGVLVVALLAGLGLSGLAMGFGPESDPEIPGAYVIFAQNDLGMHCMQEDYRSFMILPPFNTVQMVAIRRGEEPDLIRSANGGYAANFAIPGNTRSADKCNFWRHAEGLFGVEFPPDIGLTGNGLAGSMTPNDLGRWEITGVPLTPVDDLGRNDPYPLATIIMSRQGQEIARTQTVVPVSWEINCNLCHGEPSVGIDVDNDILHDHDRLHGTSLFDHQPVNCSSCHADAALGAPGQPGLPTMSGAMHGAHATRLDLLPDDFGVSCYSCHPGQRALCQRDIHMSRGLDCISCHGTMEDVADPARTPWVDEPSCASCHTRQGFEFEQPGQLFRNSIGHGGVACFACHGSPHAITPTVTDADNLQAIRLQGHAGTIDTCIVCHTKQPDDSFFHRVDDD